jgi:hypothetical protein
VFLTGVNARPTAFNFYSLIADLKPLLKFGDRLSCFEHYGCIYFDMFLYQNLWSSQLLNYLKQ